MRGRGSHETISLLHVSVPLFCLIPHTVFIAKLYDVELSVDFFFRNSWSSAVFKVSLVHLKICIFLSMISEPL